MEERLSEVSFPIEESDDIPYQGVAVIMHSKPDGDVSIEMTTFGDPSSPSVIGMLRMGVNEAERVAGEDWEDAEDEE